MTENRRGGAVVVILTSFAYFAALLLLGPTVGTPIMGLLLVPAALAGWSFGVLGGGLVALALVAVNAALASAVGAPDGFAVSAAAIPGDLMTLTGGLALGALRGWQGVVTAARQQALEKLEESEELAGALGASEQRFRLLAEEALVGVYMVQDDRFQYVNRAFARTFGYDPTEVIGLLGPKDVASPEDRALVQGHIDDRLLRGAGSAHYRFRGARKDGSTVLVEALGRALDVNGRPAILGTLLDLTRQAENEAALHLRLTALEAAPAGIVITDPEGMIQWANPHAQTLSGYDLGEMIGEHTRLFNAGRQSEAFYQELWRTVSAGKVWRGELVNRRKDGSENLEEMSITPVLGSDGAVRHFVAVKQDVTQRHADRAAIRALNENLEVQLRRLTVLREIDTAITDGSSLDDALRTLVKAAASGLDVEAAAVFLTDHDGTNLELAETHGFRSTPSCARLALGERVAGRAVTHREPYVLTGREQILALLPEEVRVVLAGEGFEVLAAVPMAVRGAVRGALVVAHRSTFEPAPEWLEYFRAIGTQGGILVDNATLLSDLKARNIDLRRAYDATIEGWSRALDLRDKETEGHSRRVTELTLRLARSMGMPEDKLVDVRRGALLHDIGKMGVPDSVLQKPDALTDGEWAVMRRHTEFAKDLLAPIEFLERALEIPYAHHERWDGSGYPEGLKGEAIPEAARVFAVADVYDALTSDRPYRPAWTHAQAIAHIRNGAGSHFDPAVVSAFLRLHGD